jgi:hypothetical protein
VFAVAGITAIELRSAADKINFFMIASLVDCSLAESQRFDAVHPKGVDLRSAKIRKDSR